MSGARCASVPHQSQSSIRNRRPISPLATSTSSPRALNSRPSKMNTGGRSPRACSWFRSEPCAFSAPWTATAFPPVTITRLLIVTFLEPIARVDLTGSQLCLVLNEKRSAVSCVDCLRESCSQYLRIQP